MKDKSFQYYEKWKSKRQSVAVSHIYCGEENKRDGVKNVKG